MNHKNDHKSGCCGGDKHGDYSQPEKDGCCDNKDQKPETDKTEKQGGCCGSKN